MNPILYRKLSTYKKIHQWLKINLFNTWINSIISILILTFIFIILKSIFTWLIVESVWNGSSADCRQATGACLAFIREKSRFILFGFYPGAELWRPILCVLSFIIFLIYSKEPSRWSRKLLWQWGCFFIVTGLLMKGGALGLAEVESSRWGGLPLTLILATFGLVFAYPIGIFLALARRSNLVILKTLSITYIELIRGVPLISLLFMSSVMFPLFLPEGVVIDKVLRAQVAIIMFVAAYMAEVVRAGLAAIPKGQYEAAEALGLNYYQTMRLVILPQALKIVIPPTVNTAIGMFKDTSLVIIIALFDLLSTTKTALKDSDWLGFSVEAYIFVGIIYFIFCFSMGKYSRRLEKELYSNS